MSTAYHPQTDGQTQRTNQQLEQLLRCTLEDYDNWDQHLATVQLAYNTAVSSSIGQSRYKVTFGRSPTTPSSLANLPAVEKFLKNFKTVWDRTGAAIRKAQVVSKKQANKKCRPLEFDVGDRVLLNSTNIYLAGQSSAKLRDRYIGPFVISEKKLSLVYRLDLPSGHYGLHPIFHVSLLKPCLPPTQYSPADTRPSPVFTTDGTLEYEVDKILGERRRGRRVEYLVSWKGYPTEDNTWEPKEILANALQMLTEYLNRTK
jgi:hypothetical protein